LGEFCTMHVALFCTVLFLGVQMVTTCFFLMDNPNVNSNFKTPGLKVLIHLCILVMYWVVCRQWMFRESNGVLLVEKREAITSILVTTYEAKQPCTLSQLVRMDCPVATIHDTDFKALEDLARSICLKDQDMPDGSIMTLPTTTRSVDKMDELCIFAKTSQLKRTKLEEVFAGYKPHLFCTTVKEHKLGPKAEKRCSDATARNMDFINPATCVFICCTLLSIMVALFSDEIYALYLRLKCGQAGTKLGTKKVTSKKPTSKEPTSKEPRRPNTRGSNTRR
jgi:hypothetical protein